jgi:hypothetical protein
MDANTYLAADAAVAAHLDSCRACPNRGCEAGLELLRVESATWAAWALADPQAAAEYGPARAA